MYDIWALSSITRCDCAGWTGSPSAAVSRDAVQSLERGDALFFPSLAFEIEADETALFSPAILSSAKNASFDPRSGRVGGATVEGADLERLRRLLTRFSDRAATLVDGILPAYSGRVARARASFRPAEIAGRASSWRKDDTRLHVDSFPATPVQGQRILRVFANVNPAGKPRMWRVGGDFEEVAGRFVQSLSMPFPGSAAVLHAFGITKTRRSVYDALMLQLHDRMKEDSAFQKDLPQTRFDFPAGTTWMAFTDQVSHAAMAGQYQLEQTFLVPVAAMLDENRSPLRILERLKGRRLA
jgi:hypothetical protein